KHDKTFAALFADPVRANIRWADAVALLKHHGAAEEALGGSMFAYTLHDMRAVFHRPHPGNQTTKPLVRAIRAFLEEAAVAESGVSLNDVAAEGLTARAGTAPAKARRAPTSWEEAKADLEAARVSGGTTVKGNERGEVVFRAAQSGRIAASGAPRPRKKTTR